MKDVEWLEREFRVLFPAMRTLPSMQKLTPEQIRKEVWRVVFERARLIGIGVPNN